MMQLLTPLTIPKKEEGGPVASSSFPPTREAVVVPNDQDAETGILEQKKGDEMVVAKRLDADSSGKRSKLVLLFAGIIVTITVIGASVVFYAWATTRVPNNGKNRLGGGGVVPLLSGPISNDKGDFVPTKEAISIISTAEYGWSVIPNHQLPDEQHRELAVGTNLQVSTRPQYSATMFSIKMDKDGTAQDDDFILTYNGNGKPVTVGPNPMDGFSPNTQFEWSSSKQIQFSGTAHTSEPSCLTRHTDGSMFFETCKVPVDLSQKWERFEDCGGKDTNIRSLETGQCLSANTDGTVSTKDGESTNLQTKWYLYPSPVVPPQLNLQCDPIFTLGPRDSGWFPGAAGVDDLKIYYQNKLEEIKIVDFASRSSAPVYYLKKAPDCPKGQTCRLVIPHNGIPQKYPGFIKPGQYMLVGSVVGDSCYGCLVYYQFSVAAETPSCSPSRICQVNSNIGCKPGSSLPYCNIQGKCTKNFNIKLDMQGKDDDDKFLLSNMATYGPNPMDSFSPNTQFVWTSSNQIQSTDYNPPSCLTAYADGKVEFLPCKKADKRQQWNTFADCHKKNTNIKNVASGKCLFADIDSTVTSAECGSAKTKWYISGSPEPWKSKLLPVFGEYDTKVYFGGLVDARITPKGHPSNKVFEESQSCASGFCAISIPQKQYDPKPGEYTLWLRESSKNSKKPWMSVQNFNVYQTSHNKCPVPSTPPPTSSPSQSPTFTPTASPSHTPSSSPTSAPTASPSHPPSSSPTSAPTASPTNAPTGHSTTHNIDDKVCNTNGVVLSSSVYGDGAEFYITKDIHCPKAIQAPNMLTLSGKVTFNGRGHTIQGPTTPQGTWTFGVSAGNGATVKNVKLDSFSKGGIQVSEGTVTLHNVVLTNSLTGLELDAKATHVTVTKDVSVSHNYLGVVTMGSNLAGHKYTVLQMEAPLSSCHNTQHDLDLYDSSQIQFSGPCGTSSSCGLYTNNIFWLGGSSFNHTTPAHRVCP